MKNLTVLTIIFILAIITNTTVCFGNGANLNNRLNGSVWTDVNANGIQELNESNMADATIFIKSVATDNVMTDQTDRLGYFTINTLAYGEYTIWGENINGQATDVQTVEISEVNSTIMVNIVFQQGESRVRTTPDFNIFLPIVNN